jgi:lipoprotein signal peptidase
VNDPLPPTTMRFRWPAWFWPALAACLILDLASKQAIFAIAPSALPAWLEHHYNTGVAWSLLDDYPALVTGLTMVLIPVLAWVWWSGYRMLGRSENLAFGLILGGALGNGFDRVAARFGAWPGVRDFIHLDFNAIGIDYIFPTFNIADSGITVGFIVLLARAFRPVPKPAASSPPSPPCS